MTTRPVRWILIVSLVLNVLLGAALATALALQYRYGARAGHLPELPSPRIVARHLHDPERAELRSILESHRPAFRQAGREVVDARRRVRLALAAEPFDPQALTEALHHLRDGHGRLSVEAQLALVELAARLDVDGRQRLARAILYPDRGHHRERGERRD